MCFFILYFICMSSCRLYEYNTSSHSGANLQCHFLHSHQHTRSPIQTWKRSFKSAKDHHSGVLQTMVCAQWMTTFCDALIACLPASTIPLDSCPKQAHGNHLSTNSCPPRAADPDACYQKLVELKNGETFNGHLVNCDNFMNITLREVYQTSADGDRFWKLKECYIRGSTVRQPIPFFSPAFVWISQRRSWSVLVCTGEPNPTQPMQSLHAPDKILACTGYPAGRGERGAGTRARGKSELKRDRRRS